MKICNRFIYPKSVSDALDAMGQAPGSVKVLAGGTDLLLDLQQGRHDPVDTLVDITGIDEMCRLEVREERLFIGAAVPHRTITTSPLIHQHAPALAEASGLIGGPQVRNVATLGGNVAHALPAADGTIALMVLDARAEIATLDERRSDPLASLFLGPGQSTLDPRRELLVGFEIPLRQPGQGSAFARVMRPQGVAIAILNCSVWLQRQDGIIADVRVSLGPSGPTPRRLTSVEDYLRGRPLREDHIQQAHCLLLDEANFRTSRHRATQAYRQDMAGVLITDTLKTAWERAVHYE
jgi:carbon-monoxide dehydrogenase medium subunit